MVMYHHVTSDWLVVEKSSAIPHRCAILMLGCVFKFPEQLDPHAISSHLSGRQRQVTFCISLALFHLSLVLAKSVGRFFHDNWANLRDLIDSVNSLEERCSVVK